MAVDILPTEQHRFYVEFEVRAEEDRTASIAAGHPVFVDVDYAVITMPGGSLVVDKKITQELLNEWRHGLNRKPPSPFALSAYQAWKDGREAPLNGMDLKNWPGITPAQIKMCHGVNIKTVEDLSQANADAQRKMGMGALALVNKAKSYLENAKGNKASEEVAALKVKLEAMQALIEKQAGMLNDKSKDDGQAQSETIKHAPSGYDTLDISKYGTIPPAPVVAENATTPKRRGRPPKIKV